MTSDVIPFQRRPFRGLLEEAISLVAGAAFTLAIFLVIAHVQFVRSTVPPAEMMDLKLMSAPVETPPPRPLDPIEPPEMSPAPITGIEVSTSDSPIKITVVPPDLAALFPNTDVAPPAMIQSGKLYTELKPKISFEADPQHVYQQSEVDRPPTVLDRSNPRIPYTVRQGAAVLHVDLLVLVETTGQSKSARILTSSGNNAFDAIVAASVSETWTFSPAIKNGKKVKCLIQQRVTVRWTGGSAFEAPQ